MNSQRASRPDRFRKVGLMQGKISFGLVMLVGILAVLALAGCTGEFPANVGEYQRTGVLAPCPDSPNCVSTTSPEDDDQHFMEPLTYAGTATEAKARLRQVIESMPRSQIIADDGAYLHAEFRSQVFRFVDDVEFVIDDADKTVQFRSASRLGRE